MRQGFFALPADDKAQPDAAYLDRFTECVNDALREVVVCDGAVALKSGVVDSSTV